MQNIITVKGIYKEAFAIMKAKFWRTVGQFAIIVVIFSAIDYATRDMLLLSIVFSIFFGFIASIMGLAYAEEGTFSFRKGLGDMTFKRLAYFSAAYLLAKIIVLGGLILLIVPGIIFGIQLFLMKYIALKEDILPVAALRKSLALTKGHRLKIFECLFFAIILNIAGALCLIVGLFVTVPMTLIAFALIYTRLVAQPIEGEIVPETSSAPTGVVVDATVVPAV
jgi:hypothetical protein